MLAFITNSSQIIVAYHSKSLFLTQQSNWIHESFLVSRPSSVSRTQLYSSYDEPLHLASL